MRYENPKEFKDEERWLNFFSVRAFKWLIATIGVWYLLVQFFNFLGISLAGWIFGGAQCLVLTCLNMFSYPESEYMKGGGVLLFTRMVRKYYRKKNKCIYVKHLNAEPLYENSDD